MKRLLYILPFALLVIACGDPVPDTPDPVDTTAATPPDSQPVADTLAVDSIVLLKPDFYAPVTFERLHFSGGGDFAVTRDEQGKERSFYLGFIDNGSDLVQNEYLYRNRSVTIGYVERNFVRAKDDTLKLDSVVNFGWTGFGVQVGDGPEEVPLAQAMANLREGDTLHFSAGAYELTEPIKLWGRRRIALVGKAGETILKVRAGPVISLENSEEILLSGLRLELSDSSEAVNNEALYIGYCRKVVAQGIGGGKGFRVGLKTEQSEKIFVRFWDFETPLPFEVDGDTVYSSLKNNPGFNPIED